MSNFQVGDIVEIKSGGPTMTVEKVGRFSRSMNDSYDGVSCVWFDGSKMVRENFAAEALDKVEAE